MEMKPKIIQLFQNKAEAFDWIMQMVQDCTIGDINTEAIHLTQPAVICETDKIIYIGVYA